MGLEDYEIEENAVGFYTHTLTCKYCCGIIYVKPNVLFSDVLQKINDHDQVCEHGKESEFTDDTLPEHWQKIEGNPIWYRIVPSNVLEPSRVVPEEHPYRPAWMKSGLPTFCHKCGHIYPSREDALACMCGE